MRRYDLVNVKERRLVELTCSVCGRDLMADEMERQEAFYFSQVGGYSSVFGDGTEIYIDICQHCFKERLGKYCTEIDANAQINDDCRLEMEAELATARDDLAAETKAHNRTAGSLAWYRARVDRLQREQRRMRNPELTLVCDIIANCALLPDKNGTRYGTHSTTIRNMCPRENDHE